MSADETVEWWANSKKGSVAHALPVGSSSSVCDRVVFHFDAYQWPDGPRCKRCVAIVAPEAKPRPPEHIDFTAMPVGSVIEGEGGRLAVKLDATGFWYAGKGLGVLPDQHCAVVHVAEWDAGAER